MASEVVVVVVLGVAALRATTTTDRAIWAILALGQAVDLAGNVGWYWAPVAMHAESQFPSLSDALFLGSYGISIGAVVYIIRQRSRGNGWAPLIDALVITAAVAGLSWHNLIEPNLSADGLAISARAVAIAYPVTDLVILVLVLRLLATGRHLPSAWLIACWGIGQLAGDTLFASASVAGSFTFGGPYFLCWLGTFACLGTAALHPSRGNLNSIAGVSRGNVSKSRMALLAVAVVMAPLTMVLVGFDTASDGYVFAGIATVIFLLVFVRMAGVVSSLGRAESLSRHLSLHDGLTGLPNRALVIDRASHALSAMTRAKQPVSLLVVDLDEFKQVNDGFGHGAGDHVLQHVADTLKRCIRAGDTAARWGGDEFCVLLPDADKTAAANVAGRIMGDLLIPVHLEGKELTTGATVGIATATDALVSAEELFRNADEALYAAKAAGKRQYRIFETGMQGAALQVLELRLDLERALAADEFEVQYQPIVSLDNGEIVEVEALIRWNHPTRGLLAPAAFVGLAEETGLIVRLGELVLRKASAQVADWRRLYPSASALKLSVNVAPRQLVEPGFSDRLLAILEESHLDPSHLVCEVTERVMVDKSSDAVSALSSLRARGIKVAIDDFGTGYSSLRYLKELPADVVKIDGSFIHRVTSDEERAFVLAIFRLVETIGLETVAEGVESQGQAEYMQAMGCDRGQGFYFAKPMRSQKLGELLGRRHAFNIGEAGQGWRRSRRSRAAGEQRRPAPLSLTRQVALPAAI
jgi:diguanylate cyclase (GGDEF)-like protein